MLKAACHVRQAGSGDTARNADQPDWPARQPNVDGQVESPLSFDAAQKSAPISLHSSQIPNTMPMNGQ